MTAVLGEAINDTPEGDIPPGLIESMRIAAIMAGEQAVRVTVHGEVAYEPTVTGQGQPFANWARSRLWYEVTVNAEEPHRQQHGGIS